MKINDNYEIKNVLDTYVLIDNSKNNNYILKINEVSKDVFVCIKEGMQVDEIVNTLFDKYDTSKEQLKKDINDFIQDLITKGIIING